MKSYKNLYEKFISDDNIRLAIKKSSKGKKKRRKDVRDALTDVDSFVVKVKKYAENFYNFPHKPKEIYDGISRKKRIIIVPRYIEQVVHHMIVQVMLPLFTKGMYEHTYASIPGRGGTKGAKVMKKWISKGGRNIKYCLKIDIKKYFDSINHKVLMNKFRKRIKDDKFLSVLETLLNVTKSEKGLPLGFYTSQWFANYYLQDMEHFVKEKLRVKYFMVYMDDMVAYFCSKQRAKFVLQNIETYLNIQLKLRLKENYQYFRFHYKVKDKNYGRLVDFMGYKFYRNRTTLRKSILCKMRRKALKIFKKPYPTIYDCKQMLSYLGRIKDTNIYKYYVKYIKGIVSFKLMKRKISNVAKIERSLNYGLEKSTINQRAS